MKISIVQYVLCTAALCCSLLYGADGVYLTLKRYGSRIAANSVININRVGREYSSYSSYYYGRYTNEGPLVCHTEDPTCCRAEDNPIDYEDTGDWFYPNGDVVGKSSSYSSFYVTRDHQTLALERSSSGYPTGVYCCDIVPMNSTENITMEEPMLMNYTNSSSAICVGLYSSSQLRRCGSLSLSNGYVTYDSPYIPGRVAQFTCNPGYTLVGPSTRECYEYGWSRYTPSCQYDCGPPPPISNGKVTTPQGTTAGRQAIYSCNEGYILLGRNMKFCDQYRSRGWSTYASNNRSNPVCVDTTLIQMKFSPSQYCLSWDQSQSSTILNRLNRVVVNAINEYRMKGYDDITAVSTQSIQNSFVSCRLSQNETTFRTTLVGSANTSAKVYANLLQAWVNEKPSIQLQWYVVDIDSSCPVDISSLYEPECGNTVNPAVTQCIDHCKRWGNRLSGRG